MCSLSQASLRLGGFYVSTSGGATKEKSTIDNIHMLSSSHAVVIQTEEKGFDRGLHFLGEAVQWKLKLAAETLQRKNARRQSTALWRHPASSSRLQITEDRMFTLGTWME